MSTHQFGFVYVLSNPSMPGLVKVGNSGYLAEDRAKQLYGTGVPEEYVVEYRALSSRYEQVEKAVHRILDRARTNPRREFFRIAVDDAIEAVRIALLLESGFNAWSSGEVQTLRRGDRVSLSLQRGETFFLIGFASMGSLLAESPTIFDIWGAHSDGDLLELHVVEDLGLLAGMSTGEEHGVTDPVSHLDREKLVANGMLNGREVIMPGERLIWLSSGEPKKAVTFAFDDYAQVLSRTWSPVFHESGHPFVLNVPPDLQASTSACKEIRRAVEEMPVPRSWAPRTNRNDEWVEIGGSAGDPTLWLPQLSPNWKIRRKR